MTDRGVTGYHQIDVLHDRREVHEGIRVRAEAALEIGDGELAGQRPQMVSAVSLLQTDELGTPGTAASGPKRVRAMERRRSSR